MDSKLQELLGRQGLDWPAHVDSWRRSVELLAALEAIGRDGASVVVKVDGGRASGDEFTVVVSGGGLGGDYHRGEGACLESLLRAAVEAYVDARPPS